MTQKWIHYPQKWIHQLLKASLGEKVASEMV
jgi:hypothetical protein